MHFHAGINATILHVMISQPNDDSKPAVRPWFGTWFDQRILSDGTKIRFTEQSLFEVTFSDGHQENWNPVQD